MTLPYSSRPPSRLPSGSSSAMVIQVSFAAPFRMKSSG